MTCPPLGDPCTGCISTQCPDHWCGCANNPECLALFSCASMCPAMDTACYQGCYSLHPTGIADASLVSGCAGTTCDASCGWGNQDFNDCQQCIFEDCSAEVNACFGQPDCLGLWTCLQDCEPLELTCQQDCYNAWPSGAPPLQDLLGCVVDLCDTVCN
jgi:hypothetical protein